MTDKIKHTMEMLAKPYSITSANVQIHDMVALQSELNTIIAGDDWITGVTNRGKAINYIKAIIQEIGEMTDSISWKWWKNVDEVGVYTQDADNIRMELVDIFHFILSEFMLEFNAEYSKLASNKQYLRESVSNILYSNVLASYSSPVLMTPFGKLDYLNDIEHEYFSKITNEFTSEILSLKSKTFKSIPSFFSLVSMYFNDFNHFYQSYLEKAVLNKFRVMNGYQDNKYVKEWAVSNTTDESGTKATVTMEDNKVLLLIMNELGTDTSVEISSETIYSKLEEYYAKSNELLNL